MKERTKGIVKGIIVALVFAACLGLVVAGQRNVGPKGLATMILGLAGLIALLGYYNRQY